MCTRPILMENKKYRNVYLPYKYKYIRVPCGECEECQRQKANSIYVRTRLEYDKAVKNGGVGFMCCLTYEERQRPKIKIDNKYYYTFNKKHIIDFIKRLRTNLDRRYKRYYKENAPDFKYLVCSEFGDKKGAPHYHMIVIFNSYISTTIFKNAFKESTTDRKTGQRYLGYILQCDIIDPKKGGIHYSAKYACKDIGYKIQDEHIRNQIKWYKHFINIKHGINETPKTERDYLENTCRRANKEYKKDVEQYIRPLRHMLQFCMVSNDLGGTAIVEKYKEKLNTHATISLDEYNYTIPRIVQDKYEKANGFNSLQKVKKNIFITNLERQFELISTQTPNLKQELKELLTFAKKYVISIGGRLMICQENEDINNKLGWRKWDEIINETTYYEDNDFFTMAERIQKVIEHYENSELAKIQHINNIRRYKDEKEKQQTRRKNKGFII